MKTKIFAYNDVLGIDTNVEVEELINNPKAGDQLGMVLRTDAIEITKEAKEYTILSNSNTAYGIKGMQGPQGSLSIYALMKDFNG